MIVKLMPEGLTVHRLVPLYKDWNEVLQHRAEITDGKYIREAVYGLKEPPQEETVEINIPGVHIDDVSVNRHLSQVGADPLCMELGHLLFNQQPFSRCYRAAQDDGAFAICHGAAPSFRIRVWEYPNKQFCV